MVLPTPACRDSIGCGIFGIDDGVQEMMGIRVLEGRKKLVLKADEAALPLSMARRLFGQSGAVGQKLCCTMSGKKRCLTVVAVIEDIRKPTSFAFSFLTRPDEECENSDNMWSTGTFIRVRPENVDKVAKAAKIEKYSVGRYPEPAPWFASLLQEKKADYMDSQMRSALGEFYPAFSLIRDLKNQDAIQARMTFIPDFR